jgi:hypothetical protein
MFKMALSWILMVTSACAKPNCPNVKDGVIVFKNRCANVYQIVLGKGFPLCKFNPGICVKKHRCVINWICTFQTDQKYTTYSWVNFTFAFPVYQCRGYVMNREKTEAKFICIRDCHAFKMDLWCAGLLYKNRIYVFIVQ